MNAIRVSEIDFSRIRAHLCGNVRRYGKMLGNRKRLPTLRRRQRERHPVPHHGDRFRLRTRNFWNRENSSGLSPHLRPHALLKRKMLGIQRSRTNRRRNRASEIFSDERAGFGRLSSPIGNFRPFGMKQRRLRPYVGFVGKVLGRKRLRRGMRRHGIEPQRADERAGFSRMNARTRHFVPEFEKPARLRLILGRLLPMLVKRRWRKTLTMNDR